MSTHEFEIEWDLQPHEFEIELSNIQEVYPELESLEITPSGEEQNFKSNKYGFDNVKVKAVETKKLNITPIKEKQHFEGLYGSVDVAEIVGDALNVTPTKESQTYSGLYETVNVEGIKGDTLDIVPSTNTQTYTGLYENVNVEGDSNLVPENIIKGTSIFGVEGNAEAQGEENAKMIIESVSTTFSLMKQIEKVPLFDIGNVTSMANAFYQCNALIEAPPFNTEKVTNFSRFFSQCHSLIEAPALNTNNAVNLAEFCYYCKSMTKTSTYVCDKVVNVMDMYGSCSNLVDLGGLINLGKAYTRASTNYSNYKLALSSCTKLTHESLMNIINNLYDLNLSYDVANGGTLYTQSLTLGSTNKAKLTEEEIAIATAKGWTVS